MPTIRLVREVSEPGNRGPSRGQYALQRALRAAKPDWLEISGQLQFGEIPWVWSYEDADLAVWFAEMGWPFVLGPNVLFANADRPGALAYERRMIDAASCLLQFTESEWYADLIRKNCRANRAPIALFSYPIEPEPAGPLPAECDVLVYHKLGRWPVQQLLPVLTRWKCRTFRYGRFARDEMVHAARRSRCCLYLSDSDRGPLGLAEVMLAGCPAVGMPRGAPWIVPGVSGVLVSGWGGLAPAIEQAMGIERGAVRAWAVNRFSAARSVTAVLEALEKIACG
jgi:hypothetical protein